MLTARCHADFGNPTCPSEVPRRDTRGELSATQAEGRGMGASLYSTPFGVMVLLGAGMLLLLLLL